jgi:hypothetical protein
VKSGKVGDSKKGCKFYGEIFLRKTCSIALYKLTYYKGVKWEAKQRIVISVVPLCPLVRRL